MKRFLFFLWLALISFNIHAQDDEYDVWEHMPPRNMPDTVGKVPSINNYGDPFSGVHLWFDEVNSSTHTMCVYQCDANARPVKQIVVLSEQYAEAPADLRDSTFTYQSKEYRVQGALRVAAVTDREYLYLQRAGKIWGDTFRYFKGLDAFENDSIRTNAHLIFVIKEGHEADEKVMPDNALELMYFRALSAETLEPISVMCAAPCHGVNQGNYNPWVERNYRKGYSCPSHWISKDEYKRWMERIGKPVEKPKPKKPKGTVRLQKPYLAGTKET